MGKKAELITTRNRIQIYLPDSLQSRLDKYVEEKTIPGTSTSAIMRLALKEFLERNGYNGGE